MIGQLGQVLVGFIDNLMVGKLGAAPLAAVSLGNGLFFLTLSLAIGFSLGITPLVAEADAQKNHTKIASFFKNGIALCSIIGVILYGIIKLLQPFLSLLNQPEEVVILANPYLNIVAFSIIPLGIFQAIKQFSDGMSATKYAMIATVAGNIINVFLNYVLIYGKWGFPRLELEGAAIGTLISRICMVIFILFLLFKQDKFRQYFYNFFSKFIQFVTTKKLLKLGFPAALQMLFEFGVFTSSIFLAGLLSTEAQAANQIALNLASMTFMVAVGLGVTATIRTGNQLGKKKYKDLIRIARSLLLLVFIIEFAFALGFIATKDYLPLFYIDDINVTTIASQLLLIVAWFQISDGFQVTLLGILRGLQDVNIPTLCLFIAYWCIGFPISHYLGKPEQMGAWGIWIGLFIGLTTSSALLFIRYRYLVNRFNYN